VSGISRIDIKPVPNKYQDDSTTLQPNMRLKDKVILVTGSTTGIGDGMVRIFAREGG
jgi:hypothetical protein